MKTLTHIIIAALVVLLMGSMPGSSAYARHSGHGSHVGIGLWLGPGWWPGWGGPYYYPSYYPYYPYYAEPPVVIQQQPDVYVQPAPQADQSTYWYYCKDQQGYYPYVKQCPRGWMKVVPTPPAPYSAPQE
jgi:hypothetical protein